MSRRTTLLSTGLPPGGLVTPPPSAADLPPAGPRPTDPPPTGLLPSAPSLGAAAIVAGLAAAADAWIDRVRYRPGSRWTALLPKTEAAALLDPALHPDLAAAQVWLLTWLPDQGTPLHDHGRSAGAFAVVRGALTETVVATGRRGRLVQRSQNHLTEGRIRHFGPHYRHQVVNAAAEPAVSVHVYTPGLTWMNTYDVRQGLLVRTGTERAGVDW